MSTCAKCKASIMQRNEKALNGEWAVVWSNIAGDQDWVCPVDGNEHEPEPEPEAVETAVESDEPWTIPDGWWVRLERDHGRPDMSIGPYPTEKVAADAMENAGLIDGECQENALECFTTDSPEATDEFVLIDLDEEHHTGPLFHLERVHGIDPNTVEPGTEYDRHDQEHADA